MNLCDNIKRDGAFVMLYVSDKVGKNIFITNTDTNEVSKYNVEEISDKFKKNHIAVGGLSYTPKQGRPRITVTTPLLLCLDSLGVGSPCRLRIKKNEPYQQCLKLKTQSNIYKFFNGQGSKGYILISREQFIKHKDDFAIDIMSVDTTRVKYLRGLIKNYQ